MATYSVVTGEGGELSAGLTLGEARKAAQRWADERGEEVYVAGPGLHTVGAEPGSDEDIGEEVEPSRRADIIITAYESGRENGNTWLAEERPSREEMAAALAPGQLGADEALLNGCTEAQVAAALGLSREQVEERGEEFRVACREYCEGNADAIRAAIDSLEE